MLKRFLKNERGLTLIELLAVVVILGIIAAIAVPAIGNIIEESNDKAAFSDALQIINAAKIAKANHPNSDIFVSGTAASGEQSLDEYVDAKLDDDLKVTYASGAWTIEGHKGLDEVYEKDKGRTSRKYANVADTGKAKEADLAGYLK